MSDTLSTWADFERLDIRIGTVVRAEAFPEAHKPAYRLWVDVGAGEIRQSSAQITHLYSTETLLGQQVVCVCGFGPKQIGPWLSEILVTGFHCRDGSVVLCVPQGFVPNGTPLK